MNIADFLGKNVASMLKEMPFKNWPVERAYEDGLEEPIIHYIFPKNGIELRCDQNDKISVIFLYFDKYGGFDESLFGVSFLWNHERILEHFGNPSKTGDKSNHPILGEWGAWDRFERHGFAIHVEYQIDSGGVKKFTLMRSDVVP